LWTTWWHCSLKNRHPAGAGELGGQAVLNDLLLIALIAPVIFLAVALIVMRWGENRLRFPQRRVEPDDEHQ
jgi:hypothetical protein